MGRSIQLTEGQRDKLDQRRLRTPSADVFRNCLIILLTDAGETVPAIAKHLRCGTDTVSRIRRAYRQGGIDALHPRKSPGRTSRATAEFVAAMKQAVQTPPQTLGYGFSTWSAARLAAHLAKVTGIGFSSDQLIRLLHRHGFSIHRPKHTLKGKRDAEGAQGGSPKPTKRPENGSFA